MRRCLGSLLLLVVGLGGRSALAQEYDPLRFDPPADAAGAGETWRDSFDLRFELATGYRQDELDWNIAAPGGSPNVLSELTWEDLQIYQVAARVSLEVPRAYFVVEGDAAYGWIVDGDNQDSDYAGDNRTGEFSRSNNATDGADVRDFSAGLGVLLSFENVPLGEQIDLKILAGYSHHQQDLEITDGFQTIPYLGPFPGLDSRYETDWEGPWVGAELRGRREKIEILLRGKYHWADYDAHAEWNLRPEFAQPKSFVHEADGHGFELEASASYRVTPSLSFFLNGRLQDWETDSGTDQLFFADGTNVISRLNEVNWESWSVMIGIAAGF